MIVNKLKKKILFSVIASSLAIAQGAFAESWNDNPGSAFQIAKKKGKIVSTEVLDWHKDSKDIPKDWVTLKNKYFTVSYPKCFQVVGEEGEGNPKLSPTIAFSTLKDCSKFSSELGQEYIFGISYEYGASPYKGSIYKIGEENILKSQKIDINGNPAQFYTVAMDSNIGDSSGTLIQMRQKIYLLCSEKVISVTYQPVRGAESLSKIEKSEFDFPDSLKQIVSTLKCSIDTKIKKEKSEKKKSKTEK